MSLTPFYISANVRRASVPCVTNPRDRGVYTEGGLRVSVSVEVRALPVSSPLRARVPPGPAPRLELPVAAGQHTASAAPCASR